MKIIPISDNILIEAVKAEEITKSGIILPGTADKEKPEQGVVIAIGPGRKNKAGELIPTVVKPGDKILFTKFGPTEIKVDGKDYLICKEEEILAVLN